MTTRPKRYVRRDGTLLPVRMCRVVEAMENIPLKELDDIISLIFDQKTSAEKPLKKS
jgi:hypothetical protein